jgi:hypothetical protein
MAVKFITEMHITYINEKTIEKVQIIPGLITETNQILY